MTDMRRARAIAQEIAEQERSMKCINRAFDNMRVHLLMAAGRTYCGRDTDQLDPHQITLLSDNVTCKICRKSAR